MFFAPSPIFVVVVHEILWGICKSTPLATFWQSLVEIPGRSIIYADEIKEIKNGKI